MVDPQGQGGPTPGNEKAWRAGVVRAMNHVAMRQAAAVGAAAAARRAARGEDDDGASVAGLSEGGASTFSRCVMGNAWGGAWAPVRLCCRHLLVWCASAMRHQVHHPVR